MRITTIIAAGLVVATPGLAQDLAQRVADAPNGTVRVSFPTRPDVCGDGRNITWTREDGSTSTSSIGRFNGRRRECRYGPALLQLTKSRDRVTESELRVGGDWPSASGRVTDLGSTSGPEAATALVRLAQTADDDAGDNLVFAAVIAEDAELREPLHALALDGKAREKARKAAVFWLGQTEADAGDLLEGLVKDGGVPLEVRKSAVFALSQQDPDVAVPALTRIIRSEAPSDLRGDAVFWLGQAQGADATGELTRLVRDRDPKLREKAVFALSQQKDPAAADALRAIVRDGSAPSDIRENAIFWLGQRKDDRSAAFLKEAFRELENRDLKDKIIFGVSQSDDPEAVRWLVDVARDERQPVDIRKQAVFWAGQHHGSAADLIGLYDTVPDRELKEQLIFVYSQGDDTEMLDKLLSIARAEPDRDLRKNAIFWIGQSKDLRAQKMLEDLINN